MNSIKFNIFFLIFIFCNFYSNNKVCGNYIRGAHNFRDVFSSVMRSLRFGDMEPLKTEMNSSEFTSQDGLLTTPQLLKKYGYPVEIHKVETSDGYILETHRIPKPGGIPVYLQHGLLDSSAGWVLLGPNKSLAYILHDRGYDVWIGNSRGNKYSRDHVYLSTKSKEFWDFSFHEIGLYDLPAMFDYIIKTTKFPKIHYIGHSQGTTTFFVMCAFSPTYCDKVIMMSALSPIAYLQHVKSPLIIALSYFTNSLEMLFKILGVNEILPNNNELLKMAGQLVCQTKSVIQSLCVNLLFLLCGYDSEELDSDLVPVLLGHIPAGASTKQIVHFGQLKRSKEFRLFDYGIIKNFMIYGSSTPPNYNVTNIKAPIAYYYSMNDWLADSKDVYKLQKKLPNIIHTYIVPMPKFNHLDFIFAKNVKNLLYNEILDTMKNVEKNYGSTYLHF